MFTQKNTHMIAKMEEITRVTRRWGNFGRRI